MRLSLDKLHMSKRSGSNRICCNDKTNCCDDILLPTRPTCFTKAYWYSTEVRITSKIPAHGTLVLRSESKKVAQPGQRAVTSGRSFGNRFSSVCGSSQVCFDGEVRVVI